MTDKLKHMRTVLEQMHRNGATAEATATMQSELLRANAVQRGGRKRKLIPPGDDARYGDRRGSDRRRLAPHQDRRTNRDRRQSWPGAGRKFRKSK